MSTFEQNEPDNSGFVSSTGIIGSYYDAANDRYRGMTPGFVAGSDDILEHWQTFQIEAADHTTQASRLTLRMVTAPHIAYQAMQHVPVEAFIPVTDRAGLLYLAENVDERQPHRPIEQINRIVDAAAVAITEHFRAPISRVQEVHDRGYRFVDHVTDASELVKLWGPAFRWNNTGIEDLERRLTDNMTREPNQRDIVFTGVRQHGHLIAAMLAERLDVPGPDGNLPTFESTEWFTAMPYRQRGLAAAMAAMNVAQCLRGCPDARILAECRISTEAYRAGLSVGYRVPPRYLGRQILARNVWVEEELADFVVLSVPDDTIARWYMPNEQITILDYLNREEE